MSLHPQKTSEKVMKAALSSVCTAENRFSRTRLPALIVFGRDIWRSGGVTWQGTTIPAKLGHLTELDMSRLSSYDTTATSLVIASNVQKWYTLTGTQSRIFVAR